MERPGASTLVEGVVGTAVAFVLWISTLSAATLPEVCFALGCAIPCGAAAVAMRRVLGDSWQLRGRWLVLPLLVVREAAREVPALMAAVWRRDSGRLRELEVPDRPASSQGVRETRAALMVLGVSATPGGLVVHVDDGLRRFVVHELVSSRHEIEEAVAGGSVARR